MRRSILPIVALILVACGDDGDDAATTPPPTMTHEATRAVARPTATPDTSDAVFIGVNYYYAAATDDNPLCDQDDIGVEEAFGRLAVNGVDVVRFWAFQGYAPWTDDDHDWSALDAVFDAADRNGLQLIPVLSNHFHHCDHAPSLQAGVENDCAWYQSGYRAPYAGYERTYEQWLEAVVGRYAARPTVKVWEMINEPYGRTECVHGFFVDMLARMRSIDPDTPRSIGGNGAGGWDFRAENANPDVTWTTLHNYDDSPDGGMYAEMPERVRRHIEWARELGKPIYVGEEGVECTYGDDPARAALLRRKIDAFFREGAGVAIGYALWVYDADDDAERCAGEGDYSFGDTSRAIMELFGGSRPNGR